MAGMEALGREYNIIPVASARPISLKLASAVGLLAVAATTATTSLAFTAAKTFGGTYDNVVPASGFGQPNHWYQQTAPDGTVAWTKVTPAVWASNVLTIAATINQVSYVEFLADMLADQYCYLKVTAVNASLVAIAHDLTVGRAPANLAKLSA